MTKILSIFLIILPLLGHGQTQNPLSNILWDRVNHCYSQFEDMDEDGLPDFDKVDDSRNGYLKIWGEWPTCGCGCSSTVGAYKNSQGAYTILQSDQANCSWERKLSSNRELSDILPESFGIQSFSSTPIEETLIFRLS